MGAHQQRIFQAQPSILRHNAVSQDASKPFSAPDGWLPRLSFAYARCVGTNRDPLRSRHGARKAWTCCAIPDGLLRLWSRVRQTAATRGWRTMATRNGCDSDAGLHGLRGAGASTDRAGRRYPILVRTEDQLWRACRLAVTLSNGSRRTRGWDHLRTPLRGAADYPENGPAALYRNGGGRENLWPGLALRFRESPSPAKTSIGKCDGVAFELTPPYRASLGKESGAGRRLGKIQKTLRIGEQIHRTPSRAASMMDKPRQQTEECSKFQRAFTMNNALQLRTASPSWERGTIFEGRRYQHVAHCLGYGHYNLLSKSLTSSPWG